MIQLSIEEPKIEQFFNNSKEEVMRTLKFIAENNLNGFLRNKDDLFHALNYYFAIDEALEAKFLNYLAIFNTKRDPENLMK